jgi:hypothetical protein
MITIEDCIAFCGLTEEEVLAIAQHEHIPAMAACALAERLLREEHGPEKIRDMIVEDMRAALCRGDSKQAARLLHVLYHFANTHPEARAFFASNEEI